MTIKLRARGREALPQLVFHGLLQARAATLEVLPFLEQITQRLARLLPVGLRGILRNDLLGTLNDGRTLGESGSLRRLALLAGDFLAFLGGLFDSRDTLAQCRDVANHVRRGNLLAQRRESLIDVARAQGRQAILKQLDRRLKIGVTTLVESVRRSGNTLGEAADDALLVSILDIDSPVLADTGEGVLRNLGCCDRRLGNDLLSR